MGSTHRISGSMEDGRFMMDNRSSCYLNTMLQKQADTQSWNNTKYREYLQQHGLQAMQSMNTSQPCGPYACADLGEAFKSNPMQPAGFAAEAERPVTSASSPPTA